MGRYLSTAHDLSAPSAARGCMDSLVQGSLVDLFSAYSVAVAPLPRMAGPTVAGFPDICVGIAFKCAARDCDAGRLTLSVPSLLLKHMKGDETPSIQLDWARELASQLIGRIKNRLLPFATRLEIGSSSTINVRDLQDRLQGPLDVRVYAGRTLRGLVLVTLEGLPRDSSLKYEGTPAATEGTLLWL